MDRSGIPVRKIRPGEAPSSDRVVGKSGSELLDMVCEISLQTWSFLENWPGKGIDHREARLPRHVVRTLRGGS